jgi:hypothetical protein
MTQSVKTSNASKTSKTSKTSIRASMMARRTLAVMTTAGAAALFGAIGCAHAPVVEAGGEVAAVTPATGNWMPVGTTLNVRLDQSLGSSVSHASDQFTATVIDPVKALDGALVVPAGAMVFGHVTGLHAARIPGEQAVIRLDFDSLDSGGRHYPFDANVASVKVGHFVGSPSSETTRGAVTGAAAGVALGAIVSGFELSKIITGGLLGAAAGTVVSLGAGGNASELPAGSTMQLRATQAVQLR